MTYGLSKSRLAEWLQCPKRLWLRTSRPDLMETTAVAERAFQVGYSVGEVAQRLHPDGILIDEENLRAALKRTHETLAASPDRPMFEATFERDGVLVRADLLIPADNGYRMVEVKSATSVKDYYLADAAIQRWVVGDATHLTATEIAHIDTGFLYPGGGDYSGLFAYVPVDKETEELQPNVPEWIKGARDTLGGTEPEVATGKQCQDPFECPFIAYCNRDKPMTDFPLDGLPRLNANRRALLEADGIIDIRHIPDDFPLSDAQARVRRVVLKGIPELRPEAGKALSALPYPRYYLDFETVHTAVPVWANTYPYQMIPVQWSCHIEDSHGQIEHQAFLAEGSDDPRLPFAEKMIAALGSDGPVFVYNQSFEISRMKELARDFPQLAPALNAIVDRVVDLLPITRDNYYHPDMHGSWSIKAVLPTITDDVGYAQMNIGNGGAAEEAWLEYFHPETPEERRKTIHKDLADYCALDTDAMVRLAKFLMGPSGNN